VIVGDVRAAIPRGIDPAGGELGGLDTLRWAAAAGQYRASDAKTARNWPVAGAEQANIRKVYGASCAGGRRVRRGHRARRGFSLGLGVPPPESSLRRLVFGREKLHHQGYELTPLRICQRFQNLFLNTVYDVVEFQELFDPSRGDGDDVTTPVLGVDRPLDEPTRLELGQRRRDVTAIDPGPTAQVSLARGPPLVERSQEAVVVTAKAPAV
jgi:hypothetical protein